MFLAQQAAEPTTTFTTFDIFMVLFTILIAIGLVRLLMQRPRKNLIAIGFAVVAFIIFLVADAKMVSGW